MNKGFTLIELMVTVLIVGILASIALPAYQKAIMKSKFMAMMPNARAIAEAEERHYLQHRGYVDNLNELDIQVADANQTLEFKPGPWSRVMSARPDLPNNRLVVYTKKSTYNAGEIHCEARKDAQSRELCSRSLGGVFMGPAEDGWNDYVLGNRAAQSISRGWDNNQDGETNIADINAIINDMLGGGDYYSSEDLECYRDVIIFGNEADCDWTKLEQTDD